MQALQIDCRLAGPWSPQAKGAHFDSLLAHVLVNRQVRRANMNVHSYAEIIEDLPLEKHENGVWKASLLHPVGWLGQERRCIIGKTDTQEMSILIANGVVEAKGGSTIDTVRGIAKNAQVFVTIEHVQGLRAWCVGDKDEIENLLSDVTAVGVKTRMGFGTLLPFDTGELWRVKPCEEANLHWMRRHSPTQLIEQSYPALGAWHPPYFRGAERIFTPFPARLDADIAES